MQPIVRVPNDKLEVFEALMQALNFKKPNQLMSLLIDLANTPEGGAWLQAQVTPKPPCQILTWERKPLQSV